MNERKLRPYKKYFFRQSGKFFWLKIANVQNTFNEKNIGAQKSVIFLQAK